MAFEVSRSTSIHRDTVKYASSRLIYVVFTGKASGQYFITNENLLDKIVDTARIRSSDTVLELGASTGSLTCKLLPLAHRVISMESERSFLNESEKRCRDLGYSNVQHIHGDALRWDFPRFEVCVSNLPFGLSAPMLVKLVKHRPLWRSCVMVLQREFVDALIADPGERNYSRLSMNMSMFFRTERITRINGASFYPVSNVEASLVRLHPRNPPPCIDFEEWNALVRTCFIEKKTNLRRNFSRPSVQKLLEANYKNCCSYYEEPTSPIPFSKYLESALVDSGLSQYCVKQLPPDAMEHLLELLHSRGIYFTSMPPRVEKWSPSDEDSRHPKPSSKSYIEKVDEEPFPLPVVS